MTRHRKGESEEEYLARREVEALARAARVAGDEAPLGKPPKAPTDYRPRILGIILFPNELLKTFPATQDDALNDAELEHVLLVGQMAGERSPKFRRFLKQAETAELTLAVCSLAITLALPRLERRNLLPPWLSRGLRQAEQRAREQSEIPVYPNGAQAPGYVPPVYAPPVHSPEGVY